MEGYKGIVFPEGYNQTFEEFKDLYASTHIFKEIPHKEREAELKKAYEIAINGNVPANTRKSKKASAKKSKE